ncbi:hypothetical protein IMZ48_08570 [Candidatus Bathyarchaeota archaeon]|nr:hypothetical protein [Candidatus Bathyarchaeota archaeon]
MTTSSLWLVFLMKRRVELVAHDFGTTGNMWIKAGEQMRLVLTSGNTQDEANESG